MGRGDPAAVAHLRAAAATARDRGVPDHAAALLREALEEPPPPDDRAALLSELGIAELASADIRAAEHLAETRALESDSARRGELPVLLVQAEYERGRHREGTAVALAAIEETRGVPAMRERWLELEASLAIVSRYDLETEARTRGRVTALTATLPGATPGERLVLAVAGAQEPRSVADLYSATRLAVEPGGQPWRFAGDTLGNASMSCMPAARTRAPRWSSAS